MIIYIKKEITDRAFDEITQEGHVEMSPTMFFKAVNELIDYYAKNKYKTTE